MSGKKWKGEKRPENNQSANKRAGNAMKGLSKDERQRFHRWLTSRFGVNKDRLSYDELVKAVDEWKTFHRW